jgi:hypothetical protein
VIPPASPLKKSADQCCPSGNDVFPKIERLTNKAINDEILLEGGFGERLALILLTKD